MPNYATNRQSLRKAVDHLHNTNHPSTREVKPHSIYLWGRKKGADLIKSDAYCEGWERVFGKKDEPDEFDSHK